MNFGSYYDNIINGYYSNPSNSTSNLSGSMASHSVSPKSFSTGDTINKATGYFGQGDRIPIPNYNNYSGKGSSSITQDLELRANYDLWEGYWGCGGSTYANTVYAKDEIGASVMPTYESYVSTDRIVQKTFGEKEAVRKTSDTQRGNVSSRDISRDYS